MVILSKQLIVETAARQFDVTVEQVRSRDKHKAVTLARQVAVYLCRLLFKHSYPELGRAFGLDHSTAMHAYKRIEKARQSDRWLHAQIEEIVDKLDARFLAERTQEQLGL